MKTKWFEDDDRPEDARPTARLVIDLETGLADDEALAIESEVVKPAGNIKNEEKKAENLTKKREAVAGNNGKLDSNPIQVIGLKFEGQFIVFTWGFDFSAEEQAKVKELQAKGRLEIVNSRNEKRMLRRFAAFCNAEFPGQDVRIIAWNGNDFDFRRLRFRYAVKRVTPPDFMAHGAGAWWIDLMEKFAHITVNPDLKKCASLKSACLLMGVKYAKTIEGKDIPQAIADKKYFEVLESNLADVREVDALARRMGY